MTEIQRVRNAIEIDNILARYASQEVEVVERRRSIIVAGRKISYDDAGKITTVIELDHKRGAK